MFKNIPSCVDNVTIEMLVVATLTQNQLALNFNLYYMDGSCTIHRRVSLLRRVLCKVCRFYKYSFFGTNPEMIWGRKLDKSSVEDALFSRKDYVDECYLRRTEHMTSFQFDSECQQPSKIML